MEIPYKYDDLSMIVFLPNNAAGLAAFERSLTPASLEQWLHQMGWAPVILTLPRFKTTRELGL